MIQRVGRSEDYLTTVELLPDNIVVITTQHKDGNVSSVYMPREHWEWLQEQTIYFHAQPIPSNNE